MSGPISKEELAARTREMFASDLSRLVTGNLSTTDEDPHMSPEAAVLHIAAAQAKAILIAYACEAIDYSNTGGFRGWDSDHKFTPADLQAALSGLTTLLESGRHVIEHMRLDDLWRDSWHRRSRVGNDNEQAKDGES